jgi:hypothetical protein
VRPMGGTRIAASYQVARGKHSKVLADDRLWAGVMLTEKLHCKHLYIYP